MGTEQKPTVNVALSPELGRYVREKVATGLYASASEVVREALRVLRRLEESVGHESRALDAGYPFDREKVRQAVEGLKRLRPTQRLGTGTTIRDLIDEGRP